MAQASWFSPKVVRQASGVEGTGLFAISTIDARELVVVKGGTYLTGADIKRLGTVAEGSWLQIDVDLFVGASTAEERPLSMTCVNHNCDPTVVNLGMRGNITGFAKRRIEAGEELFYEYATMFAFPGWLMHCECDYANCRRLITSADWQLGEIRSRNQGWFTTYVQSLIDADVSRGPNNAGRRDGIF